MKKYNLIIIILLLTLLPSRVIAGERVIYTFEQIGENSGKVYLRFADNNIRKNIQITGYTFLDKHTLQVSYSVGTKIDSRSITIINENMEYPLKIFLVEGGYLDKKLSDLPSSEESRKHILHLYDRGVISGYPDGSFKPSNPVSREEIAAMIVAACNYPIDTKTPSSFKDVKDTDWAKKFIVTLSTKGIVSGKGNGIYDPKSNVTIGEVLTILYKTFEVYNISSDKFTNPTKSHWSNPYYIELGNKGIVKKTDSFAYPYNADKKATREDCAILISRVLENVYTVQQ